MTHKLSILLTFKPIRRDLLASLPATLLILTDCFLLFLVKGLFFPSGPFWEGYDHCNRRLQLLTGASRERPKGLGRKSPRSFKGVGRCQKWHPPPELVGPFWPGLLDCYTFSLIDLRSFFAACVDFLFLLFLFYSLANDCVPLDFPC